MFVRRYPTEKLDKAIAQHAVWLETAGRAGKRLDLHGQILNGRNLSHLDLRGAIFRGAQLSWINFTSSNLSDADLCGATMNHAVLIDTNLMGANLSGVNLRCSDLTGAHLTDAILLHTDMRGAIYNTEAAPDNESEKPQKTAMARPSGYTGSVINKVRQMISTCSDIFAVPESLGHKEIAPSIEALIREKFVKTV